MRSEHGKIDGDLVVEDDFELHGMVTGRIEVRSGGHLVLHGMAASLLVEGGNADLYGMVVGNVVVNGGRLQVFGMINGSLVEGGGTVIVDPDAVIHGGRRRASG